MRRALMIAVLIVTVARNPVYSQIGFGLGSTEATQILNHGELVLQYLRQAEQLSEAVKQTADMLRNTKALPAQLFGPIAADVNALASIVQGGQALAYSLSNLDSLFKSRFPGYALSGDRLLHSISKLVPDFPRHNSRRPTRSRPPGSAASE